VFDNTLFTIKRATKLRNIYDIKKSFSFVVIYHIGIHFIISTLKKASVF